MLQQHCRLANKYEDYRSLNLSLRGLLGQSDITRGGSYIARPTPPQILFEPTYNVMTMINYFTR